MKFLRFFLLLCSIQICFKDIKISKLVFLICGYWFNLKARYTYLERFGEPPYPGLEILLKLGVSDWFGVFLSRRVDSVIVPGGDTSTIDTWSLIISGGDTSTIYIWSLIISGGDTSTIYTCSWSLILPDGDSFLKYIHDHWSLSLIITGGDTSTIKKIWKPPPPIWETQTAHGIKHTKARLQPSEHIMERYHQEAWQD